MNFVEPVVRGQLHQRPATLVRKGGAVTLGYEPDSTVTWDAAGRPWSLNDQGTTIRRGLDGQLLLKRRDADGVRRGRVAAAAAAEVADRAARLARAALDGFAALPPDIAQVLAQAASFDAARHAAEAQRFRSIWSPPGILPPDCYLSVIVQGAIGCSFNTCTFCELYHDIRYRVRPPAEFAAHVAAVVEFLGAGLELRPHLFLGDANALAAEPATVEAQLEILQRLLPGRAVHAFLDGFSGSRRTPAQCARLRQLGLRRVYIGMESGDDELLRFARKPGNADDVREAVLALKQGGLLVGVILLAGLGGARHRDAHLERSLALLRRMELGQGDLVYVSPFVPERGSEYVRRAAAAGIDVLDAQAVWQEKDRFLTALRGALPAGVKAVLYDIRDFLY